MSAVWGIRIVPISTANSTRLPRAGIVAKAKPTMADETTVKIVLSEATSSVLANRRGVSSRRRTASTLARLGGSGSNVGGKA